MSSTPLQAYEGRINDLDSHLMVPVDRYPEILGSPGDKLFEMLGNIDFFRAEGGEAEMTRENVWNVKGTTAPGAGTPEGRLEALDLMGVRKQLVFPQVVVCFAAWGKGDEALEAMRNYNDFVMTWTRSGQKRLRPCVLLNTRDLDIAFAELERVVRDGARAALFNDAVPPGGVSPADAAMDRFWALLSEADVPFLLHIAAQPRFFASQAWAKLETFSTGGFATGEPVNAHLISTLHMAPQNYVQTMVMGGVFERHPRLRVGAIELGAHWVGPMAELMDTIVEMPFSKKVRAGLSMKPSETLRRNFRATPFIHEDIATMIDRYGLEEIYAFSTDFPHTEGGRDPIGRMGGNVSRLGNDMLDRFFVDNGEWLLPS